MRRIARLLSPLRSRPFTLIWLGQGVSQIGDEVSALALVWLLVGITGSSLLLGAVLAVAYIPTLALLLLGGVLADRSSGRAVALVCDGLRTIVATAFAALVILRVITLTEVFAFAAIYGLVSAFFNPALSALYPALVPPDRYDAATSLRQMTTQFAALGGPALAGVLIARWSVGAALAFDAATFAISFLALALAGKRREPDAALAEQAPGHTQTPARRGAQWSEMFAGLRFLRTEPSIFILILLFSLTNGLNDVVAVLTPRLARVTLHLPATAFGLFSSCMGVGALLGALVIGMIPTRPSWRAQIICGSLAVFGLAIVLMGVAHETFILDIAFAIFGVTFIVPEVVFGALLQRVIPTHVRGRVYSVLGLIAMAMNPAGMFLAGWLGDAFGPRGGLWIGGGAITALAALALLIPAVRALNHRDDAATDTVTAGAHALADHAG